MCGLAGYVGPNEAYPFLKTALNRLEYRGYDSWGVAVANEEGQVKVLKDVGAHSQSKKTNYLPGHVGIAHTRWATHGKVCEANTHPIKGGRVGCCGEGVNDCWVVHNGIVENGDDLRSSLEREGYSFVTETDTEVIAHLISLELSKSYKAGVYFQLEQAVARATKLLKGSFAFLALTQLYPEKLVCYSRGMPLLVTNSGYVASDIQALAGYANEAMRLSSDEIVTLTKTKKSLLISCCKYLMRQDGSLWLEPIIRLNDENIPKDISVATEGRCHMLSEIMEQPEYFKKVKPLKHIPQSYGEMVLFGCGSSYNAALLGRHYFELLAQEKSRVEYATELTESRLNFCGKETGFIALTQSGETKDTVAAMEPLWRKYRLLSVVTNNPKSAASTYNTSALMTLDCGPEFGVAATKTFSAQAARLYQAAKARSNLLVEEELNDLSRVAETIVADRETIQKLAISKVAQKENILFLGRGAMYAIAREGALKMLEVSYKHAQAMPASEVKHGPIALIDEKCLSIFLVSNEDTATEIYRILSNIEEVKCRGGEVLIVTDEEAVKLFPPKLLTDAYVTAACKSKQLQPIAANIVLQLLAYYTAVHKRIDVDKPRNLSKAVTV